jgi:hypothetical protein
MASVDLPGWVAGFDVPSELLQSPPLLLGIEGQTAPVHEVVLRNLFACHAGLRSYADAAREYIRGGDFAHSAQCWTLIQAGEKAEVARAIEVAWRDFINQIRERLQRLMLDVEGLKGAYLKDCQEALNILSNCKELVSKLPQGSGEELIHALARLNKEDLARLNDEVEYAAIAVDDVQKQHAEERGRNKQRVMDLKKRVDALIEGVLFTGSEEANVIAEEINRRFLERVRRLDVQMCEQLLELLEVVHTGADVAVVRDQLEVLFSSASPKDAVVVPVREIARIPPSTSYLSPWTVLLLSTPPNAVPPPISLSDQELVARALRTWDSDELSPLVEQARYRVNQESAGDIARGAFLLGAAKLSFVKSEMEEAHVAFRDLFRFCAVQHGAVPDLKLLREAAVWGFLLSILIPHLPEDERTGILAPDNLKTLFYRQIGDIPLTRFDQLLLFNELAYFVLELGAPFAANFVSGYLISYFVEHPLAAQELAEGLLFEAPEHWSTALGLLALLFERIGGSGTETLAPALREIAEVIKKPLDLKSNEGKEIYRDLLERLRRKLVGYSDRSDLAQAVVIALTTLEKKISAASQAVRLAIRILTPEIDPLRERVLVVEIHYVSGARTLRNVRADVDLVHSSGQIIPGALAPAAIVPRLAPGEIRELTVRLLRQPERALEGAKLKVVFGVLGSDRTFRKLEVNATYLSLSLRSLPYEEVSAPQNPYVVGKAVDARELIYGRDEIVSNIVSSLIGQHQDNAVLVLGERRMGKTTVLNVVERHPDVARRYIVVRLDIQDVPPAERTAVFFRTRLIDRIRRILAEKGIHAADISDSKLRQNAYQGFKDFMEDLDHLLKKKDKRVLLIIDEMEKLLAVIDAHPSPTDNTLGMEAMAALRSVIQSSAQISFIMAGVTDVLRKHTAQVENRLFRLALEVELTPLPEPEARKLVREPAERQKAYSLVTQALDFIIRETSSQPYLLQYVCRELWTQMIQRGESVATLTLVEEVIAKHILPKEEAFQHLVDAVPDPVDRRIVSSLGALQFGDRRVPVSDLQRQLSRTGTTMPEEEIAQRLLKLRSRAPMLVDRQGRFVRSFRLTAGLFARRLRYEQGQEQSLLVRRSP